MSGYSYWEKLIMDDYEQVRTLFNEARGATEFRLKRVSSVIHVFDQFLDACIKEKCNPLLLHRAAMRRAIKMARATFPEPRSLRRLLQLNYPQIERQAGIAVRSSIASTMSSINSMRQLAMVEYGKNMTSKQFRSYLLDQSGDRVVLCCFAKREPDAAAVRAYLATPDDYQAMLRDKLPAKLKNLTTFEKLCNGK